MLLSLLYTAYVIGLHDANPILDPSDRSWASQFNLREVSAMRRALSRLSRCDREAWRIFDETHGDADAELSKAAIVRKATIFLEAR